MQDFTRMKCLSAWFNKVDQKGFFFKKERKTESRGKEWNNKPGKKKKIETNNLPFPTSCCLIPVVPFCLVLFVLRDNPLGQEGYHLGFSAALTLSDSLDVKNSNNNHTALDYIRRSLFYLLIL